VKLPATSAYLKFARDTAKKIFFAALTAFIAWQAPVPLMASTDNQTSEGSRQSETLSGPESDFVLHYEHLNRRI
jgi:hypothetical protein